MPLDPGIVYEILFDNVLLYVTYCEDPKDNIFQNAANLLQETLEKIGCSEVCPHRKTNRIGDETYCVPRIARLLQTLHHSPEDC